MFEHVNIRQSDLKTAVEVIEFCTYNTNNVKYSVLDICKT